MTNKKLNENIYIIIYTFIITFIFIGTLSFINYSVKERIKENEDLFLIKAIIESSGFEKNEQLIKENIILQDLLNQKITNKKDYEKILIETYNNYFYKIEIENELFFLFFNNKNLKTVFNDFLNNLKDQNNYNKSNIVEKILEEIDKGNIYSIIFIINGPGLWGEITATVGIKTLNDKNFNEITGIEFIKQSETPGLGGRISEKTFKDSLKNKIIPLKLKKEGETDDKNNIDGITGATITTNYVINLINYNIKNITEKIFLKN